MLYRKKRHIHIIARETTSDNKIKETLLDSQGSRVCQRVFWRTCNTEQRGHTIYPRNYVRGKGKDGLPHMALRRPCSMDQTPLIVATITNRHIISIERREKYITAISISIDEL